MEPKTFDQMNFQEKLTAFYTGWNKTMQAFDAPEGAATAKINFAYTGAIPLLGVKPGCGCQKLVIVDGELMGDWNMSGGAESSFMEVYADDGEELMIVDASGVIVDNPRKIKMTLQLTANVPETAG